MQQYVMHATEHRSIVFCPAVVAAGDQCPFRVICGLSPSYHLNGCFQDVTRQSVPMKSESSHIRARDGPYRYNPFQQGAYR